ncbi:HesA/MoeB/ThiF family protein [Cupriavidus pauculus]|jgi:molybdopterin/thiamine biosynthesis adenylyltransferase|uniref:HesA/MoeB/ThiF family protein n=1 Tax=Cupriavidus pauculus TaxID=82633 RepID=UPI001246D12A|nr:molybdopterin-synthase adenylyltransferase MoeB [Cupriavidus pauculus]KAB0598035.1 molybdopterin-synthase adenylyltransferase MoeB [Cupriavidus pauculus]MCM3604401.1 molybdopterin-synthase adenylyltransferase MoeB [Cupriavidus pauculus]UAK98438.1 molybdopterin-synthase adenylyltransferase MoeB [Cupriavidus pauculus]
MNDNQLLRYSRHILLDEIGIEGQERLLAGRVLVVGAGGLGAAAMPYLASAGVGHLTIVDDDDVDLTNLQRQILHTTANVGRPKVESAREGLLRINPDIDVELVSQRVGDAELDGLVAGADVVLDCCDNFATRQAVNRACLKHRKPLVSGAALRFDGQVSVYDLRQTDAPCYGCLFPPSEPAPEAACATMGVFAPLVGMVGTVQAAEALKVLAGVGQTLSGRLLMVNAMTMEWTTMRLARTPDCEVCGESH